MEQFLEVDNMARTECTCGNLISTMEVPNDIELWVYTDKEWQEILKIDIIEGYLIPDYKYSVWRCPACERVYVFESGNYRAIKVYALEESHYMDDTEGCRCGAVHPKTLPPGDTRLWAYKDREWDAMVEELMVEPRKFPPPKYDVRRCPDCERIYALDRLDGKAVKVYALEEDDV